MGWGLYGECKTAYKEQTLCQDLNEKHHNQRPNQGPPGGEMTKF